MIIKTRNCPECGVELVYKMKHNASAFYQARKKNAKCKPCSKKGENNSFYGKKHSKKTKKKYSENRKGEGNGMYGKPSAMLGKRHTEEAIRKQSEKRKEWWRKQGANPTEFESYRYKVDVLTAKQPIHLLENFDKRGRAGDEGAYHLDHIISVWYGFHNNIPPEQISDISNLRMIPWMENQQKWIH